MEDLGLDAWTLAMREDLRPWANAGLRHVLCEQEVAAFKVSRETPLAAHSVPTLGVGPTAASSRTARPAKPAPAEGWTQPVKQQAPATPVELTDSRPCSSSAAVEALGDEPEDLAIFPWELFRPRLRVPSRQVWTYWDLGLDFGPEPLAERRDLFSKILHFLKWPAGSVTFWPHNFEHRQTLVAQPGQFWRGVREAQARSVVVFGQRAFKILFPREPFAHGTFRHNDLDIVVLPGPTQMLSQDAEAKRIVWDTLRNLRP